MNQSDIRACCEAVELFGEDELERAAKEAEIRPQLRFPLPPDLKPTMAQLDALKRISERENYREFGPLSSGHNYIGLMCYYDEGKTIGIFLGIEQDGYIHS